MDTQKQSDLTPGAKATALRSRYNELAERASRLTEAAHDDVRPKLHRLETMLHALERDIVEAERPGGADSHKVDELQHIIDSDINELRIEVEALGQGNPTTVSAALDATINAVERIGEKVRGVFKRDSRPH
ncbi:MAG: hypothetical protein WD342_04470 [Verrucomicrobiales bacterium]